MKIILLFSFLLILNSCQKGTLISQNLSLVSGFSVNQISLLFQSKTITQPFTLSGTCDKSISDIEISFNTENQFFSILSTSTDKNINCTSDQSYNFLVLPHLLSKFQIQNNKLSLDVYIRGKGDFGYTPSQKVTLLFNYPGQSENFLNSALSTNYTSQYITTNSGTQYNLKSRIISNYQLINENGYKLKSRLILR